MVTPNNFDAEAFVKEFVAVGKKLEDPSLVRILEAAVTFLIWRRVFAKQFYKLVSKCFAVTLSCRKINKSIDTWNR